MLRRKTPRISSYDLWQLVDTRKYEDLGTSLGREQIICDIDKTYLETSFDSWTKMARIAFEVASDKITVAGASEVLLAARWGDMDHVLESDSEMKCFPRPLHFVSASPPQLRSTLEEKLMIDGLDWSSDTFKNQAYNLRKRQFSLLRQQVSYKTAAILKLMESQADSTAYYLVGDNAESDPYIYLGIKLLIERQLSKEGFEQYLGFMGVETSQVQTMWKGLERIPHGRVLGILIRKLEGRPDKRVPIESFPIIGFDSFFEVGVYFYLFGLISHKVLWTIIKQMHNRHGLALADARQVLLVCSEHKIAETRLDGLKTLIGRLDSMQDSQSSKCKFKVHADTQIAFSQLCETEILVAAESWAKQFNEKLKEDFG